MPRRPARPAPALLALAVALPATLACAAEGERASSGACPPGEACSPLTPRGLLFQGLRFSDVWLDGGLHATAAGGSQPIVVSHGTGGLGDGPILALPYTPLPDDDAFVATADGGVVTLTATAPASGRLRIVDVDGLLMDRIAITALAPTRLELRDADSIVAPSRRLALAAGARVDLVAAVFAADGTRLVDGGLRFTGDGLVGSTWDLRSLAVGPGPVTVEVATSSGLTLTDTLPVVAAAERLEREPGDPLRRGQTAIVCVAALTGERQIIGLPMTWTEPVGATIQPLTGLANHCAWVTPSSEAPVGVTVAVPGVTTRLTLPVGGAALRTAPRWATDEGDRARLTVE